MGSSFEVQSNVQNTSNGLTVEFFFFSSVYCLDYQIQSCLHVTLDLIRDKLHQAPNVGGVWKLQLQLWPLDKELVCKSKLIQQKSCKWQLVHPRNALHINNHHPLQTHNLHAGNPLAPGYHHV